MSFIAQAIIVGLSRSVARPSSTSPRKSATRPVESAGISRGNTRIEVREEYVGCGAR